MEGEQELVKLKLKRAEKRGGSGDEVITSLGLLGLLTSAETANGIL